MKAPILRRLPIACLVALLAAPSDVRAQAPPDPELVVGIRQVKEGDFETALLTLDGVAQRLTGDPSRVRDLAQACLYLGIAALALDQKGAAKGHFHRAAEADRTLRLSANRFSPKVIAAFDEARREVAATGRKGGSGSKVGLVALGVGGAAAAIAVAAKGGGSEPGVALFANARFGTPVIECPNGSKSVPISFTILVDGTNTTGNPVTVNSVSATVVIEASAIPSEIGLASSLPAMAAPDRVASSTTVTVTSALLCDNAPGNVPRFNEWSGRVTLTTSAGVFPLTAADRLRVNVP
jgi:hypothetical protein